MDRVQELDPEPILVEDYTASRSSLWATDVGVPSFEIVGQNEQGRPALGAYVTYHVVLLTTSGSRISVYKRYSEFEELRQKLILARPLQPIPDLPGKTLLVRYDKQFLEQRRKGLEYFMKCVVLNRQICDDNALKQFFKKT